MKRCLTFVSPGTIVNELKVSLHLPYLARHSPRQPTPFGKRTKPRPKEIVMQMKLHCNIMRIAPPPRRRLAFFGSAALITLACLSSPAKDTNGGHYVQVNLVSDQPGVALLQDTNLVNAWGIS